MVAKIAGPSCVRRERDTQAIKCAAHSGVNSNLRSSSPVAIYRFSELVYIL